MNDVVDVNLSLLDLFSKVREKYGDYFVGEDGGLKVSLEDAAVAIVAYNIFSETDCMEYLSQINEASKRLVDAVTGDK